ncbi:MAG: N-acetylmuramoyl-L-alanine amidase-like domain-containing protein, partial [Bacteroidota bacterium]
FLKNLGSLLALSPLLRVPVLPEDEDERICLSTFELAVSRSLQKKPIREIIVEVGKSFLGTPYEARTLEVAVDERLIVNLRAFDCVTYVENVVVSARLIRKMDLDFSSYKEELQYVRYRRGIIDKYPSRLHYFSDWIHDNEQKGVVVNVTGLLGGFPYKKSINYMTANREGYMQLANDAYFEEMKKIEAELSKRPMYYIPKERVQAAQNGIQSGDLIGITTKIKGLDIIHTGIALRMESGALHYLHAPNVRGKVKITEKPLHKYLAGNSGHTGIMVARPLEPQR